MNYNHTEQDVQNNSIQKIDDEQLEVSGFVFQEIEDVILQIYKVNNIQASSYIELQEKYKNEKSIIKKINYHQLCFLWCILAYLYPVEDNKKTSKYVIHMSTLCTGGQQCGINVFELTGTVLTPIHINTNYDQPQIDLLLYENH